MTQSGETGGVQRTAKAPPQIRRLVRVRSNRDVPAAQLDETPKRFQRRDAQLRRAVPVVLRVYVQRNGKWGEVFEHETVTDVDAALQRPTEF